MSSSPLSLSFSLFLLPLSLSLLLLPTVRGWPAIDPDVHRNFTEIVQAKGYPCEVHHPITSDGYILTVFRIPHGKANNTNTNNNNNNGNTRPAVLLQHGLLDSSFTWILNEPTQSLPYLLADAGFDVWMGNNRGNRYSNSHTTLKPTQKEFWQFSWDQMASFDFPTQIHYVKNISGNEKIFYVGHSQGTIQAFAGLISNPSLADSLHAFFGYGPVATVGHLKSELLYELAKLHIDQLVEIFGFNEFLPSPTILKFLFADFCVFCPRCCDDVIELLCGPHQGAFNDSRDQVMASHEPGGTSVQNMAHWAQSVRSDQYQSFDYGEKGNLEHYGTPYAPVYNFSYFPTQLPLFMYTGSKDLLADPIDMIFLKAHLPQKTFWLNFDDYAHLDFCWAIDANTRVYKPTMQQMFQILKQDAKNRKILVN